VMNMIQQKVAGEEIRVAPEAPKTNVIDLMAALQASLEASKPSSVPTEAAEPAAAPKSKGRKKAKETVS
ncbi:MAG: ykoV, partial [Paenibacillus sp.]|nr:ykoV [Paenibacillus sp.]